MDASASRVGPRFFKILLQGDIDQDQNMLIPKKFGNEHCRDLSSKVTLELPNRDVWLVELVRDDNGRVWFKKGWQQLSRHYCFQHGHFLHFELQGKSKSHFSVVVFDRSAAEIDYSKFTDELAPAAAATNIPTKQPFFSKVITKRSSSRGGPNFPLDFVRKHITRSSMELLQLRVGDRKWEVKLLAYDEHGYSVPGRGWLKFATDNLLKEGDVCTFEVVNTATEKVLNVHIERYSG